jgi:O-methyltransferase
MTKYDPARIHFIEGDVEKTLPDRAPSEIAFLRLDTDWYESTRHELVHLYPRLVRGGVLIIDDYGHFLGARKATDEYFDGHRILLDRIDYSGRIAVKQDEGPNAAGLKD